MTHANSITSLARPSLSTVLWAFLLFPAGGGQVVRTAAALPPGIYATETAADTTSPTFEKDLKKGQLKQVLRDGGKWHFHFVAYLSKPAPADQLNIVFYDLKAKGKQEPVAYPINTRQGARIVASEVTCSPEDSVTPGSFDVRITFLADGKEQVLAHTRLDLK